VFFKRFEEFLTAALSLKFVNLTTIGLGLVDLPSLCFFYLYGFCIFNFQSEKIGKLRILSVINFINGSLWKGYEAAECDENSTENESSGKSVRFS
jgi:hypothetical protein